MCHKFWSGATLIGGFGILGYASFFLVSEYPSQEYLTVIMGLLLIILAKR
jgi:hypothetical protein